MLNLFYLKKPLIKIYFSITSLIRAIQSYLSPLNQCKIQNFFCFLIFSSVRFSYHKELELYSVKEGKKVHYFSEATRGFDFYQRGLKKRSLDLFKSYGLNYIDFKFDDIVIDCGANYADLFIELTKYINKSNYIAFEPAPREFQCIKRNTSDSLIFNKALSNVNNLQKFYLSSGTGDSSLVEPTNYSKITYVETTTLDEIIKDYNLNKIKLLKLEAEGWEPEILEGTKQNLKIIEYVSVDGGPERGINEIETLSECKKILFEYNFKIVHLNTKDFKALFRNESKS